MKIKVIVSIIAILVIMLGCFLPVNISAVDEESDATPPTRQIFCHVVITGNGDFHRLRFLLYWEILSEGRATIMGYDIDTKAFEINEHINEHVAGCFIFFFGRTDSFLDPINGYMIEIRGFALISLSYVR